MDSTTAPRIRTEVTRRIHADPTSTALLLAGPTALELWPGVRRVGAAGKRALVEARLAAAPQTAATVRALPPRRTPTSFVTCFAWTGPGLPATDGELTLDYLPGNAAPATLARLVLDSAGVEDSRVDRQSLSAMAQGFLANLADAAERRSSAA